MGKDFVVRCHLKTGTPEREREKREELIKFCLQREKQCLAIGWSYLYNDNKINTFQNYVETYKKNNHNRTNPVIKILQEAEKDDLFWTRDLKGFYWICRVKDKAQALYDKELDIGAILPVEAYKVVHEVPGQIKASFNRKNGGTAQRIKNKQILNYSKYKFNKLLGREHYKDIDTTSTYSILENLPDFDLEELVISYIQVKHDYYVLSNSIAKNSTTPFIECEFRSRKTPVKKAVVQVKAGNTTLDIKNFQPYLDAGFEVFLYSANIVGDKSKVTYIAEDELKDFYNKHKSILPDNITIWENLFTEQSDTPKP